MQLVRSGGQGLGAAGRSGAIGLAGRTQMPGRGGGWVFKGRERSPPPRGAPWDLCMRLERLPARSDRGCPRRHDVTYGKGAYHLHVNTRENLYSQLGIKVASPGALAPRALGL